MTMREVSCLERHEIPDLKRKKKFTKPKRNLAPIIADHSLQWGPLTRCSTMTVMVQPQFKFCGTRIALASCYA